MEVVERITFMDAILFSMVLEVTLLQLKVLDLSSQLRVQLQCRNKEGQMKRDKMKKDLKIIKEVIRKTILELVQDGKLLSLSKSSSSLEQRTKYIVQSKTYHEELKASLSKVTEELKTNKLEWSKKLQDASRQIAILQDKIKDDGLNARIRLRYAEKWLAARQESQELRHAPKMEPPPNATQEERVHKELLHAYELQIKSREESLEYWRKRYIDDTAQMDVRVLQKIEEFRASVARREELQQRFNLHEGEMRAWLTFKQERAARLAREEKLRNAATCLQAWWRGVMVRKALGCFKHLKNIKKAPNKTKKK